MKRVNSKLFFSWIRSLKGMFWQKKKNSIFFYECLAIFDFLGKWLLNARIIASWHLARFHQKLTNLSGPGALNFLFLSTTFTSTSVSNIQSWSAINCTFWKLLVLFPEAIQHCCYQSLLFPIGSSKRYSHPQYSRIHQCCHGNRS